MNNDRKSEIKQIRESLEVLNSHKFVRIYNSPMRVVGLQFLKGVAFGLGSVVGATIVVSILITLLAQIEFIPIVGEWAKEIMVEIQQGQ